MLFGGLLRDGVVCSIDAGKGGDELEAKENAPASL
jgi:hypothetical protein